MILYAGRAPALGAKLQKPRKGKQLQRDNDNARSQSRPEPQHHYDEPEISDDYDVDESVEIPDDYPLGSDDDEHEQVSSNASIIL